MNVRKSILRSAVILSSVLFSMTALITSCENFMNGNVIKDQIIEKIKVENAPSADLRISIINQSHGNLLQEGLNEIKIGVPFELSVEPDQEYEFVRWVAYKKDYVAGYLTSKSKAASFEEFYTEDESCYVSDSIISFSNPDSCTTSVTVHAEKFDAVIVPLIVSRPRIIYSSVSNVDLVDARNKILITFNRPLDPEKLLMTTQKGRKTTPVTYEDMVILNPKYAYCMVRPRIDSKEEECTPAITYFEASIEDNKLCLTPMLDQVYFHTLYDELLEETDNDIILNYYKPYSKKYNPQTTWWISDTFGENHHDLARQYMDLYFTEEFEDVSGVSIGKKAKLSWARGTTDKTPPVFLDVRFFNPCVNYTGALGFERKVGIDNTDTYYLFSEDYVLDNELILQDYEVDDVNILGQNIKRTIYGFISNASLTFYNRIKNHLYVYIRAGDSDSDGYPDSDINVKSISYGFYKVRDGSLNPVSTDTADKRINIYKRSISNNMVTDETELQYENGAKYHFGWNIDRYTKEQGWDYDQILAENRGEGIFCDFDLYDFSEGLYCLQMSGMDMKYNSGSDKTKYNFTDNKGMYSPENKDFSAHNMQYWFYVDKTPPSVTASDFPKNPNWYNAETIINYYLPYDSEKKIKDENKGIPGFESYYIQRICRVLAPGETWTPDGFEDKGWENMYVTTTLPNGKSAAGYPFNRVYKDDSWYPSDLADGKHTVSMYVKDSVNNLTRRIDLTEALLYDNTSPEISGFESVNDRDGSAVSFGMSDLVSGSGIKSIRYSIEDEDGNSYDDFHYIYCLAKYLKEGQDYEIDKVKKIITLKTDIYSDDVYIGPEFPSEDTKLTVKFSLIDNAGNESEQESVELEYYPITNILD